MSKICSLGFCKRTSRFLVTVGVGIGLGLIIANVNRDNDQVYRNSESPFVSNAVIEEVKTTDHGQIEKTNLEVAKRDFRSAKYDLAISQLLEVKHAFGADSDNQLDSGELAFYLSLSYQAIGNRAETRRWWSAFQNSSLFRELVATDEFFEYLNPLDKDQPIHSSMRFVALQPASPMDQHRERLEQLGRKVIESNLEFKKRPEETQARIRLATWQMLFAEYSTLNPIFGQISNARWAFSIGDSLIEKVTTSLDDAPELLSTLASTKDGQALIMRLDAVQVRNIAVQNRMQLSISQERQRLDTLRQVTTTYRDMAESVVGAHTYHLTGDHDKATEQLANAMQRVVELRELTKYDDGDQEYYLFEPEPDMDALESSADFKIVNLSGNPFSDDLVGQLKSINGFTILDKVAKSGDVSTESLDLLQEAIQFSEASLSDGKNIGDLPVGFDANGLLGLYVLAESNRQFGRHKSLLSVTDSQSRVQADDSFVDAKTALNQLKEELANHQGFSDSIVKKSESLDFDLGGVENLISASRGHTLRGDTYAAKQVMDKAISLYHQSTVWNEWIHTSRRIYLADLGADISVFSDAIENDLVSLEQADGLVALSLAELTRILREYALVLDQGNDASQISIELVSDLKMRTARLSVELLPLAEKRLFAQVQACNTALTAMLSVIAPESVSEADRNSAYAGGINAKTELIRLIDEDQTDVVSRECLIAVLRGLGHIGTDILKTYHDDPIAYFIYAHDVEASLPFGSDARIETGTPLLNVINARTEQDYTKQVNEERRSRFLVSSFLESSYVLHFGDSVSAADGTDQALATYEKGRAEVASGVSFRAEDLSELVDGFDANVTLHQSVQCFRALSHVASGEFDTALKYAIQIPDGSISIESVMEVSNELLTAALNQTQSPLVAYTIATSLEEHAITLAFEHREYRSQLIAASLQFFEKGISLMELARLGQRYQHLQGLLELGVKRLESPNYLIALIESSPEDFDITALRKSVRRHPENEKIWELYLQQKIDLARLSSNDVLVRELIVELNDQGQLLPEFVLHMYLGVLNELVGETDSAIDQFKVAVEFADSVEKRAFARSRLGNAKRQKAIGE